MATSDSESRSGLVLELAEEFLDRYRAGERPALKEYIDRHPDLAAEIREVFPAMAMMEHIALADETMDAQSNGAVTIPHLEQLGDYRVLREVGRGGMGVVYEAEQVSLGRHVALKVLPPQSLRDAKQRRRFEREARAAAKLHHTNIVPVFGVGEQEETPYYVMQFIQGQGLDAVLDELKRLRAVPKAGEPDADKEGAATAAHASARRDVSAADVARSLLTGRFEPAGDETEPVDSEPIAPIASENGPGALSSSSLSLPGGAKRGKSKRQTYWEGVARIGHQVADALAYAHAQGIVHRDIKPSNLLLDTKGTVWVADFGLAKVSDQQDLTHSGDLLGTLRYMPPEAFTGKADARGDIYSLGLTLYEMLAFRPAFDESDRGRLVRQVTNEEPPRLKKLNPEVPRDLETIVQKSIERDPNHRYASASDLADDLRRFVDDEPIQARRASVVERVARWGRRNPAVAGLIAAVSLLLFAVFCGLWYGYQSSKRALIVQTKLRTEAEREKHKAELAAARESDQKAIAISEKQRAESANQALLSSQDSLRSTLYAAQMNLTKVAWDSGTPSRTLDLLAATTPKPGEPDLRGFEWYYWRRQAHRERTVRKLSGIDGDGTTRCVFSPDASLAGSALMPTGQSHTGNLLVHDTATGKLLHKIPFQLPTGNYNSGWTSQIGFSADGQVVGLGMSQPLSGVTTITENQDWEVQTIVWNLADGRQRFHDSEVVNAGLVIPSLSVSGDGSRIAAGWMGLEWIVPGRSVMVGALRVLDCSSGREYLHWVSSSEGCLAAEISLDGHLVATSTLTRTGPNAVDLWPHLLISEVETGRVRFDLADQKLMRAGQLRFSPDGRSFAATTATPAEEASLLIVDVAAGKQLVSESLHGYGAGASLTYTPDGRSLVVGSTSGPAAQVRDVRTGRLVQSLSLDVRGSGDLAIRPSDGRLLSIKGEDLREWELPPDEPASLDAGKVIENSGIVNLTRGGRRLVAERKSSDPSKPGAFVVADVSTGQVFCRFPSQESGTVSDPNSQILAAQSNSAGTRLASIIGNRVLGTSRHVAATRLRIWDLTSGRGLLNLDHDRLGGVPSASYPIGLSLQAWDEAGKRLALAVQHADRGPDGKLVSRREWSVTIVEVPSGRIVRTIPVGTQSCVPSLRPDGKLLAIATTAVTGDGPIARVDLVDPDSGRIVHKLSGKLPTVVGLIFSREGRRLVAASADSYGNELRGAILIWDLSPGAASEPVRLGGLNPGIISLALSPDGRRLASGTSAASYYGGEVKLWDTATGRDLATWSTANGVPQDLAFDGEGRQLRAAILTSGRGEVRVMLLDASPLAPEIEAVDLVNRLRADVPSNAELAAKVEAEAGLDPAVRASALAMVRARVESPESLSQRAASWLQLAEPERTPELMRRALAHAEQAIRLMDNPSSDSLRIQAEARYRNSKFAEALEPLRKTESRGNEDTQRDRELPAKIQALIAMAEAKLGHRANAEAALANYRRLWAEANPKATTVPPLQQEAEKVLSESFPTGNGSKSPSNP